MALLKLQYKSKALMRGITVHIILPTDGMAGAFEPPYKTLYFLPGYSADSTELFTYLRFRMHSELKGIAVVIPDGENLFYQDYPDRNTYYSTYAGEELVEETRKLLPLSDNREDTFIGGISMGGYGALYNGLKFSRTFSKIIAFSPAADCYQLLVESHAPGFSEAQFHNYFGSREAYQNSGRNLEKAFAEADKDILPDLFLCCGTGDRAVYREVRQLEEMLVKQKVKHTYREEEGDHDLDFWERMMDPAFSFLAGIPEGTRHRLVIPD